VTGKATLANLAQLYGVHPNPINRPRSRLPEGIAGVFGRPRHGRTDPLPSERRRSTVLTRYRGRVEEVAAAVAFPVFGTGQLHQRRGNTHGFRLDLRPLGIHQYVSVHPQDESHPHSFVNPRSSWSSRRHAGTESA
jgi:hypothetical protein